MKWKQLIPRFTGCLISLTGVLGVPGLWGRFCSLSLTKLGFGTSKTEITQPRSQVHEEMIHLIKASFKLDAKLEHFYSARACGSTGTACTGGRVPPGPCSGSSSSKRATPCATAAGSPHSTPLSWEVMWWRSMERCEKFCDIWLV